MMEEYNELHGISLILDQSYADLTRSFSLKPPDVVDCHCDLLCRIVAHRLTTASFRCRNRVASRSSKPLFTTSDAVNKELREKCTCCNVGWTTFYRVIEQSVRRRTVFFHSLCFMLLALGASIGEAGRCRRARGQGQTVVRLGSGFRIPLHDRSTGLKDCSLKRCAGTRCPTGLQRQTEDGRAAGHDLILRRGCG